MANINYGPLGGGGFQATVSDQPGYGLGGGAGMGDMSWMMDLARRRAEQKMHMGDIETAAAEQAYRRSVAPTAQGGLSNADPYQAQMKNLAMQDAIAQNRAHTQAGPMTYLPGYAGHSIGRFEYDPAQMSYYQRQAFLPQSNTMGASAASQPVDYNYSIYDPQKQAEAKQRQSQTEASDQKTQFLNSLRMYRPDDYLSVMSRSKE